MSLYPHQMQFPYKSPTSSVVSGPALWGHQPEPHFHHPVNSLYRPQRSSQRPEATFKSYWSLEVAVHTGAALLGVKGQSWVGQVRLNVPALLPWATKVSSAQFIPWPRLVNSASPMSIEIWFVIKFFNSQPAHIIPWKIEKWLYRCTRYSLDWFWMAIILTCRQGPHKELVHVNSEQWLLICCCFQRVLLLFKWHSSSAGSWGQL